MEHFIKNIEITNFKSIRHAEIKDCRRVNVFVGPPNVGKSNILEALSGFSLLSKSNLPSLDSLIRYENLSEFYFNGDTNSSSEVSINSQIFLNYNFVSVNALEVNIQNQSFEKVDLADKLSIADTYFSAQYRNSAFLFDTNNSIARDKLFLKKYDYYRKTDYFPSEDNTLISPFGNNLRDIVVSNNHVNDSMFNLLSDMNMNLAYDQSEKNLKVIKFIKNRFILTLPFSSIADTLQRLIFYKAAILSNKNTILLFEEPEAHCYEPYILEFTNSVKRDQNNNQFFIVTHSQYVVEEFLRDEKIRNDTNIYLVGLENNETQIKLLSQEMNKEIYQTGLNVFFNYQSLWNEISEHEAVH